MQERRKAPRGRTLKAGTISFKRAGGIDCRVRNMSPAGACLEVSSQVGIPTDFVLVVGYDKFTQTCHVIWRSDTRLGVEFRAA
jgi:PilZ domain